MYILFLRGLNSLVLVVPVGAQRTSPNPCSQGSTALHTKYSPIAMISLRRSLLLRILPISFNHFSWFGSESSHVLIFPWDARLKVWDELGRINWVLILDTLIQQKQLKSFFGNQNTQITHTGLLSAEMLKFIFRVLLTALHLSNAESAQVIFGTKYVTQHLSFLLDLAHSSGSFWILILSQTLHLQSVPALCHLHNWWPCVLYFWIKLALRASTRARSKRKLSGTSLENWFQAIVIHSPLTLIFFFKPSN